MSERICARCGKPMRGFASYSDKTGFYWLCHPDEGEDCYSLWTNRFLVPPGETPTWTVRWEGVR